MTLKKTSREKLNLFNCSGFVAGPQNIPNADAFCKSVTHMSTKSNTRKLCSDADECFTHLSQYSIILTQNGFCLAVPLNIS